MRQGRWSWLPARCGSLARGRRLQQAVVTHIAVWPEAPAGVAPRRDRLDERLGCSRRSGYSASSDLLREGWSKARVFLLWAIVVSASTIAAGIGYAALKDASGAWISAIQAFSGGAILTMLADEMIPEAFDYTDHNKTVGVALAFGFAVSAALSFRT